MPAFYMLGFIVYESVRAMQGERLEQDAEVLNSLRFYRQLLEQKRQHARRMAIAAILLVAVAIVPSVPQLLEPCERD